MKKIRVGINGFGRIGRQFFRLSNKYKDIEVVAINDVADISSIAHLLKFDSIHGRFGLEVKIEGDTIVVDNSPPILVTHHTDISNIEWDKSSVDIVIESTGRFRSASSLSSHLDSGARKVILTSPPLDDSVKMIVLGINDHLIDKGDKIISNASCTTNSAAPLIDIIHKHWGIESAYITTVHSFTNDQNLHDSFHKDLRRSRSSFSSIIPTTTGAAKALTRIFPDLSEKIGGCGIRVPVPNGSLTDLTCIVSKDTNIDEGNKAFKLSQNQYIDYIEDPLVSIDIIGSSFSSVFDSGLTSVIGKMIKVVAWYDNESGYAYRLLDLVRKIS